LGRSDLLKLEIKENSTGESISLLFKC
jgi:hypothetical protein